MMNQEKFPINPKELDSKIDLLYRYIDNYKYNSNQLSYEDLQNFTNMLADYGIESMRIVNKYKEEALNERKKRLEINEERIKLHKDIDNLKQHLIKLKGNLKTKLSLWERITGKISKKKLN